MASEKCPECGEDNLILVVYAGRPMTCGNCGYNWELYREEYEGDDESED